MDLSIIIVNWNSAGYLKACIASIERAPPAVAHEIVVIDSASFDGCDRMLRESFPHVRFIQLERNLGFGRANNAAFASSTGTSVLFLNPDTEVVGDAIATMYDQLQRSPNAGAVGCRLLNSDGSLQTSCVQSFPTIVNQVLDAEWLRARWPASSLWGAGALYAHDDTPKPVDAIVGACVMFRREVFERIGGFSDDYFMYAEDIDLCHKALTAGLTNYYVPDASVIHHGGGSSQEAASNFSVVLMRESICRFLCKTRGRPYGAAYRLAMFGAAFVRLALLSVARRLGRHTRGEASWRGSPRKWRAVLRWSLFRRATVSRLEPAA